MIKMIIESIKSQRGRASIAYARQRDMQSLMNHLSEIVMVSSGLTGVATEDTHDESKHDHLGKEKCAVQLHKYRVVIINLVGG